MSIIVSAMGQGLLWSILGIGLFLTFRVLDFPDMTVEGSFPLGACVSVAAITRGVDPVLSLLLAFGAGMLAGLATGLLYTKGKVPVLLAGILVMTALYSVNQHILGRANLSLLNQPNLFNNTFLKSLPPYFDSVLVGTGAIIVIAILLMWFLQTNLGQAFIATGDNEIMAQSLGIHTDFEKNMGLMVANGLVGLAGGLIAQNNGYADVNQGIGVIVIGLAAIIIGEVVFGELTLNQRLVATVLGSILYRFVLLIVLGLGFGDVDLKLISAVVLAIMLMVPTVEAKVRLQHALKKGLGQEVENHE
ncbi:ABC transporter permease [Schleiferilactobacillus perolens]|uniref:Ribose xylose arabinose galactoside ABC-type transporter permease n=1 Tax=Schleiferilactobacillus perolens DSM 12744 TaxID=1423792 RepID=A0A0R1N5L0_9LACO|nr:branched-chain amino acid ABC transporter permease [Schleiferilactobacillus perolens]KRL12211.1 ribose xylose arabinose galactoside ABC-type transporter permease [Schleiferilactobacillus perolens DSM 12744]